jgi:transposase-like protein
MGRETRSYTDEERAEAIAHYVDHGAAQAGRMLNIPPRTIRYWANQAGLAAARDQQLEEGTQRLEKQHAEMREELRLRLLEVALLAIDRMTEEHIDYRGKDATEVRFEMASARDMQAYATTLAIVLDKYRLEVGESTSKTEVGGRLEILANGVDINAVK